MPGTSYALSDVERLAVILDDVIRDWDDQDKAVMHDLFARAGQGAADDEVDGFSFSWGDQATPGPGPATPGPGGSLFDSFKLGLAAGPTDLGPGSRVELNPQPLPP
jgi:hypothetical protein